MTGHIAFAGFVLTAEEWAELEPELREPITPALAAGSGPVEIDETTPVISVSVTGSVLVGA
jgi:hypothetical protein